MTNDDEYDIQHADIQGTYSCQLNMLDLLIDLLALASLICF